MSFSFEFVAQSKGSALDHLANVNAPQVVKDMVSESLRAFSAQDPRPILVKATGHIYAGAGSYEVSSCTLEVKPFTYVPNPEFT